MRQDFTTWIYRPLGVLIKHLGGWEDPSAIRGAITGALQCLTMGHPYVMKHPQTQMLQFAIAEIGWKETYEESWKEIIQFYTKPIGNGDDGDGGNGDDGDGVVGIADGNDGKRGGGKKMDGKGDHEKKANDDTKAAGGGPGGKPPGGDPKPDPNQKKATEDAKIYKKAGHIKTTLVTASHQAISILDQIADRTNPEFFWAAGNDAGEKRIQVALNLVRGSMTDLTRKFVMSDAKTWAKAKGQWSAQQILEELRRFNEKADDIKALADANAAFMDVTARLAGHA